MPRAFQILVLVTSGAGTKILAASSFRTFALAAAYVTSRIRAASGTLMTGMSNRKSMRRGRRLEVLFFRTA